jgi:hypothetical protein
VSGLGGEVHFAVEVGEEREAVLCPRVDEGLARLSVGPVDRGLALELESSPLLSRPRSSAESSPAIFSRPRVAERTRVTVSIVATAS